MEDRAPRQPLSDPKPRRTSEGRPAATRPSSRDILAEPDRSGAERVLALQLSDRYLTHGSALAWLAFVFDGSDPRELLSRLDDAAVRLFGLGDADLHDRADALTAAMFDAFGLQVELGGYDPLLLGRALDSGRAHPLVMATVAHELARRAGFESIVARSDEGNFWTILLEGDYYLPVGFVRLTSGAQASELHGCCAHEIACSALELLASRAPNDSGALAASVRARLPFAPSDGRAWGKT